VGYRLDGTEVVGVVGDLPSLIRRQNVKTVLLADAGTPGARIRELLDLCSSCRASFKIVPASFSHQSGRVSTGMLHDLSPEDLLPRGAVAFDEAATRVLVQGRRVLVTGAGGSIGGEICRQLVLHGAQQVVMLDMNENELYLGGRRLAAMSSGTTIAMEVADVREPARLARLGARYRPQIVFHAAAHKHVPMMEDAPEEAVKNNVFGTLNVARMADECGAERFVLISTDKAVNPTSVMGVSKRIAEMAMRHLARSSRTRMTAVRFGNVLGSAGSVVPLFKEQIERGGPVTVTHPDCKRYFMTIPEAVGLVLMAGLGGHGDLCVLDMGEQIKIADLARNLITLSGNVPGQDIPIVYTGLRPGEKLYEELLTEEEEETRSVSNRIFVARSPEPPQDLEARLEELWRIADAGDADGLRKAFCVLVPTYQRALGTPPPRPRPIDAGADARPAAQAAGLAQPSLVGVPG
jgi:FlaA1/EpsC-like NDP-sugar epimerase